MNKNNGNVNKMNIDKKNLLFNSIFLIVITSGLIIYTDILFVILAVIMNVANLLYILFLLDMKEGL